MKSRIDDTLRTLTRHGAMKTLLALAEDGSLSMAQFTRASHLVPDRARQLRDRLEQAGLIRVDTGEKRGFTTLVHINLTPRGARIATHLRRIRDDDQT